MKEPLAQLQARFLRLLDGARLLSLDVFDTTLGRRCSAFPDVFLLMEEDLTREFGSCFKGFVAKRRAADRTARERIWSERQREEIDLSDIYRVLMEAHPDWPIDAEALAAREMGAESRLLYPIPLAAWMIREARNRGLQVVFTSDMYLPRAFCESCLRENGFTDFDAFFLSSEVGVLKFNGKLFDHLLVQTGIPASQVLHVGDNLRTDVQQPAAKGIRTLQVPLAEVPLVNHPLATVQPSDASPRRLLLGLAKAGARLELLAEDAFWFRIGYQIGGPLLTGYTRFIADRLAGRGLDKVFFLSRDGCILKQAYDRLAASRPDLPGSGYLYASRRALNFASLEALDPTTENWLAEGIHLRVEDFLRRINLEPEAHLDAIRSVGFSGPGQLVVEGADYTHLRELYRKLEPVLVAAAADEREAYLDYLEQEGAALQRPLVLVDVGWMASIQHSFRRLLRRRHPDIRLEGHYLGTYPEARGRADAGSLHACYLMEYGQPQQAMATIRHCVGLLEFFFAAPEKTFIRMERLPDGSLQPQFALQHENAEDLPALAGLHHGMLAYLDQALALNPVAPPVHDSAEVMALLHRLLAAPTSGEAARLGDIRYADGYGAFFHHAWMARPPRLSQLGFAKTAWKKAFKASHWPRGWVARLQPWERLLFRCLHPKPKFSKPYG